MLWEAFSRARVVIALPWKGVFLDFFYKQPLRLHTNYEALF
jgi:hypothetical protein